MSDPEDPLKPSPRPGTAIAEQLANIPDDVQLYVYCYTGQTASQTTAPTP